MLNLKNESESKSVKISDTLRYLTICYFTIVLMACLAPSQSIAAATKPDFYTLTTTAPYRPVQVPGTQRRVAQQDAEEQARKELYEYIGSFHYQNGTTVNDVLNRDARLKARVLEIIRNSETVDWAVCPQNACVQVWVRLDINKVRAALGQCGY